MHVFLLERYTCTNPSEGVVATFKEDLFNQLALPGLGIAYVFSVKGIIQAVFWVDLVYHSHTVYDELTSFASLLSHTMYDDELFVSHRLRISNIFCVLDFFFRVV